jgi:FKBP-type peptidyl-prolyl cis-trans isomerase SlyD
MIVMTITKGSNVKIEYKLVVEGDEVDSNIGGEPLSYIQGENHIVPGLEKQLEGMSVGEEKSVEVVPEEGYGPREEKAILEVSKDKVPVEGQAVGMTLGMKDQQGRVLQPVVSEVKEETIVLDFNHPLAGKTLNFDVKVVEVA